MVGRVLGERKVLIIGTTAEKSFEIWYKMPCPTLEAALHAQSIIFYIAVPFGFPFSLACADRTSTPFGGKDPSVLLGAPLCSPWEPQGAVPARWRGVRACVCRPVALAWSAGCGAGRVSCCALPCSSGAVCIGASVQLPEVRVAWLGGGSLGCLSSSLPEVFCYPVPWCLTSLKPLPWDITCMRAVCPDARTLCALPWGTHGLVSWCMTFSGVMRAGGFQGWCALVSGRPVWCSGLGSA